MEQGAEIGTEEGDGTDDDHRDKSDHEAVLNGGDATVTAQRGESGLELDELSEHFGLLHGTGRRHPGARCPEFILRDLGPS